MHYSIMVFTVFSVVFLELVPPHFEDDSRGTFLGGDISTSWLASSPCSNSRLSCTRIRTSRSTDALASTVFSVSFKAWQSSVEIPCESWQKLRYCKCTWILNEELTLWNYCKPPFIRNTLFCNLTQINCMHATTIFLQSRFIHPWSVLHSYSKDWFMARNIRNDQSNTNFVNISFMRIRVGLQYFDIQCVCTCFHCWCFYATFKMLKLLSPHVITFLNKLYFQNYISANENSTCQVKDESTFLLITNGIT